MPNYAQIINGIVTNIIVADDGFLAAELAPEGATAMDVTGQSVGIGWTYTDGQFAPPPRRELTADKATLIADGTDTVTVTWIDETTPDGPVTFAVSGQAVEADKSGGTATITVTADTPGTITVAVPAADATLILAAY